MQIFICIYVSKPIHGFFFDQLVYINTYKYLHVYGYVISYNLILTIELLGAGTCVVYPIYHKAIQVCGIRSIQKVL